LPIPYYSIINSTLALAALWLLYYYLFVRLMGQNPHLLPSNKISYTKALFLSSLWVGWAGEIIRFTANTIGLFLVSNPADPAWRITHFLDETLGHIMSFFAFFLMAVLGVILEMEHKYAPVGRRGLIGLIIIGLLSGLGWSVAIIEGELAKTFLPIMVIFIGAILIWGGLRGWRLSHKPWSFFVLIVGLTATVATLLWGFYWGSFPQFSDLGWL